jgi:hypothetical protein
LEVDPKKRITVKEALLHPWVIGHDILQDKQLESITQNMRKMKTNMRSNASSPLKIPFSRETSDTDDEIESSKKREKRKSRYSGESLQDSEEEHRNKRVNKKLNFGE